MKHYNDNRNHFENGLMGNNGECHITPSVSYDIDKFDPEQLNQQQIVNDLAEVGGSHGLQTYWFGDGGDNDAKFQPKSACK